MADINPWTSNFQSTPTGTDLVSEGDNRILDTRHTVREEFAVEHDVGNASVDGDYLDTGRHIIGSARAFLQAAAPTTILTPTNGGVWPPANPNSDRNGGAGASFLDNGRLWVDADDCQPYVREQVQYNGAAWTDINTNYPGGIASWTSLWPRSFAVEGTASVNNEHPGAPTNDTRDTITNLTVTGDIPDDGRAYEVIVMTTIKYWQTKGTGGSGFWLEETSPNPADRDGCLIDSTDAAISGSITLMYTDFPCVNGDTYTYVVDMASENAANLYVNPTAATLGLAGIYNTNFQKSQIIMVIRPRYKPGVGAY